MKAIKDLEPKDVFCFFEEIAGIPHGSGNTEQISNYLVEFAKKRKLEHYQDEAGNVILIKEAAHGYEEHPPVLLQGHMDMVAVKTPECSLDMEKDGLEIFAEDDWLGARGTSLGGDDGIAVAYGLALLDGSHYKHPRVELVVTVDEEVGMNGAKALDVSPLKAKRMINLDSEEEGIFLLSCAGGARVNLELDYEEVQRNGLICEIAVSGLQGGHSGQEIYKERGNAICLLSRVLCQIRRKLDFGIKAMEGGVADNAIPSEARAKLLITGYENEAGKHCFIEDDFSKQECLALIDHICEKICRELRRELRQKDEGIRVESCFLGIGRESVMDEMQTGKWLCLLNALPWGVQAMSAEMTGLVETSLNPGILQTGEGKGIAAISVRSSVDSAREALVDRLNSLAVLAGAAVRIMGDYPGWSYRKDSPLRDTMIAVYQKLYQEIPKLEAIHAGMECGVFAHKIPELDCVSIGPDMKDIHTAKERLSIPSVARVWTYLLRLLEEL